MQDIVDNLIDTQEKNESVLSKDEEAKLKEWFGLQIGETHITVDIKGLSQMRHRLLPRVLNLCVV